MIPSAQPNKPKHTLSEDSNGYTTNNITKLNNQISSPLIADQPATDTDLELDQHSTTNQAEETSLKSEPKTKPTGITQFWQRLSLRNKAVGLAITLGTIPVLAVGTIAYQSADLQVIKQITANKASRVEALNDEVARFMLGRYKDIQTLARADILTDTKLRAVAVNEQREALERFLEVDKDYYDSIAFFDLKGDVIVQTKGPQLPNHADRDYFQAVLKSGRPVISQPQLSTTSGELDIFFAAPVKDQASGQTIGIIRSRMPLRTLEKLAEIYGTDEDEYLLFDASGKSFVSNDEEDLGKEAKLFFKKLPALIADKKTSTQLDNNLLHNEEHLFSYAPLRQLEGLPQLNWGVVITENTDTAYAAQNILLRTLGIGTAVTALLVSILAAYAVRRAIRPILSATDAVEKLGQGELDTRVAVSGEDELAALGSNINQMAGQLQGLLREQEIETERTQLFTEIAGASISSDQDLENVFNLALTKARASLNADRVVIYRFNSDWSGYIAAEAVVSGLPVALNDKIQDSCIPQQLIEAYRNGRVVPTSDVFQAGFHPDHMKLMERLQIKANLVTPIVQNDQLYGLLVAHYCNDTHAWQQSEITFLKELSARLGSILDRVSFLAQKEAEAERSRLLKDITVSIAQALNPAGIFDKAVQEVRQALGTDRVVVYSFNDKWQGTVIAEAVAEGYTPALGAQIADPCFADKYVERYRQGRVQATNNIAQAGLTDCHLQQLAAFEVKANLVAPILQGKQLLGLLIAHQCDAPRVWQQGEIDLFSQLATQVGFALDRANLLEQQRSAKEQLQRRALELLMEVDPISRGDLTIRASVTEDEIGTVADSYNATIASLRKIVTQVQAAAAQMATTTNTNESSVQALSAEAMRQTAEITAALDRIQQMSDSIRAVAESAAQAEVAVQQATETVAAGDLAMNRTVDGILAIRETVAETSKKVKRLGESSQKISKVVNLISTFADQTNLLALNASIEAAHAGEQGRGFAVVADEVRTLARQSATATAEIETLVKEIQTETNEVVAAMEAGTEQVVSGTKLVDDTRLSLNRITAVSAQISQLVAAIGQAAVMQSQASESVTITMTDVAAIAQQTSNEATVVSTSFRELLSLAQELQASASQFKVS